MYRPSAETLPAAGITAQVTAGLLVPVTLAVNCRVWRANSLAVVGATLTATVGVRLTMAEAVLVGSATLVALTVTVWAEATDSGAVYKPVLEMEPTGGLIDHVTAVFAVPVTVAVNCWL